MLLTNVFSCVFAGNLPQGVRGGPVWRLREHEPGPVCCSQHTIWNKVWIRSQGWLLVNFLFFHIPQTLDPKVHETMS